MVSQPGVPGTSNKRGFWSSDTSLSLRPVLGERRKIDPHPAGPIVKLSSSKEPKGSHRSLWVLWTSQQTLTNQWENGSFFAVVVVGHQNPPPSQAYAGYFWPSKLTCGMNHGHWSYLYHVLVFTSTVLWVCLPAGCQKLAVQCPMDRQKVKLGERDNMTMWQTRQVIGFWLAQTVSLRSLDAEHCRQGSVAS